MINHSYTLLIPHCKKKVEGFEFGHGNVNGSSQRSRWLIYFLKTFRPRRFGETTSYRLFLYTLL